MDVGCCSIQLIDRDGVFNHSAMKYFMRATNMDKGGLDYAVVSMLGKKKSGKSTLLNHLFGTDFYETNASKERPLTTKGIWLAKCTNINTFTVVLDFQGAVKKESRQDDSELEKQRITFALAVSDIVLINMWWHDIIGTQEVTDPCLLKTVFEVWMRTESVRRITLLLIIRDKSKTPIQNLKHALRQDILKIRNSVLEPYKKLSDFFRIEVVALASYKENKKLFKEQVATLRKLYPSIPSGRLDAFGNNSYPASEFSIGTQKIWNDIKDNKNLNLIVHRAKINSQGCEKIIDEIFPCFLNDEEWLEIERIVQNEMVPGLIEKLFMIFDKYLTVYDTRACFFRQDIRELKRNGLKCKLNMLILPSYLSKLEYMSAQKYKDYFAQKYAIVARGRTRRSIQDFDRQCEVKLDHFILCNEFSHQNFEESITKTNYQSNEGNNERSKKVCRLWAIMALGLLGFNEMMTLFRFFQYHYYITLIAFALFLGFILRR